MFTIAPSVNSVKKLIAILLLALFSFNLGGYTLIFQYFIYKADRLMNEQISKDRYRPTDLVQIKIPVQLTLTSNWTDYEPVSGQVQLNNGCYNYVKLKITKDTLYLMCLPNYEKTRLVEANVICAREISDLPLSKKSHSTAPKLPGPDSKYNYCVLLPRFTPPAATIQNTGRYIMPAFDQPVIMINGQPPEAIS